MKFISIILFMVCALPVSAQTTYTDHLQQRTSGQGKVTIVQDKKITDLVNNAQAKTQTPKPKTQDQTTVSPKPKTQDQTTVSRSNGKTGEGLQESTAPTVDYSKKIMKNAVKVDGFRVQIYSGGNSRIDKNKAQQIGHEIKFNFPDQPVYVHFKSPHWICRMGNYRTRYEAEQYLKQVKELGYQEAIIVKGKISVSRNGQ